MNISKQDREEIIFTVADQVFAKLANELDYYLMEHENFTATNDAFIELHNEMTKEVLIECVAGFKAHELKFK